MVVFIKNLNSIHYFHKHLRFLNTKEHSECKFERYIKMLLITTDTVKFTNHLILKLTEVMRCVMLRFLDKFTIL